MNVSFLLVLLSHNGRVQSKKKLLKWEKVPLGLSAHFIFWVNPFWSAAMDSELIVFYL